VVKAAEARAVAARWVAEHGANSPGFGGAFLSGSAAWLPAPAELPPEVPGGGVVVSEKVQIVLETAAVSQT
jgi:hypothetical protein